LDKFRHLRKPACGMPLHQGLGEAAIGSFKSSIMRANHFVPAQAKAIGDVFLASPLMSGRSRKSEIIGL
jgi:hypothetical protein